MAPGSTNAMRPFVIRCTTSVVPVIGLEEHPLRAPARVHEAVSDEARKGRIVRLPDREVHEHGRGDRGASDEWIERLRERLQLGQLWHLAAVSGELPHAASLDL